MAVDSQHANQVDITGTPTATGTVTFNVTVNDAVNQISSSRSFTVAIKRTQAPPRLMSAAQAIAHSEEHFVTFVTGLYKAYLRRAPDVPGLYGWVIPLKSRTFSDEVVTANFIGAGEYVNHHGGFVNGLPTRGWVIGLYNDLLNRT